MYCFIFSLVYIYGLVAASHTETLLLNVANSVQTIQLSGVQYEINRLSIMFAPSIDPRAIWIDLELPIAYQKTSCVAVISGDVVLGQLIGCIGSVNVCGVDLTEKDEKMGECSVTLLRDLSMVTDHGSLGHRVGMEITDGGMITFMYYTMLSRTSIKMTTLPVSDGGGVGGLVYPTIRYDNEDGLVIVDPPLLGGRFSVFVGGFFVGEMEYLSSVISIKSEFVRDDVRVVSFVGRCGSSSTEACIGTQTLAKINIPYALELPMTMRWPVKRLFVQYPSLYPMQSRGDSVTMYLEMEQENGVFVDSVSLTEYGENAEMAVGDCTADHVIHITAVNEDIEVLIYTTDVWFSPSDYCLLIHERSICFCESGCLNGTDTNRDGLFGLTDPDCSKISLLLLGEDDVEQRQEEEEEVDNNDELIEDYEGIEKMIQDFNNVNDSPRNCRDLQGRIDYNHLPIFDMDYSAVAHASVSLMDPSSSYYWNGRGDDQKWSWAIMLGGHWFDMGQTAGRYSLPNPYSFQLRAGKDYKVKFMVTTVIPGLENTSLTDFACLIDTPVLYASPPISISILSPINTMSCRSDNTLIMFDVASNVPLPFPMMKNGGYQIVETRPPTHSEFMSDFLVYHYMVVYPFPSLSRDRLDEGLAVLFDFDGYDTVRRDELITIVVEGLHPATGVLSISKIDGDIKKYVLEKTQITDAQTGEYTCGVPTVSGKMTILNTGSLPHFVSVDGMDVGHKIVTGLTEHTFDVITSHPLASPDPFPVTVSVGLRFNFTKSRLLDSVCPPLSIAFMMPPYVPITATVELVSITDTSQLMNPTMSKYDQDKEYCKGRRLFRFHLPQTVEMPLLSYYTQDDDMDIGKSTRIFDGYLHFLTVGRPDIVLHTYLSSNTDQSAVRLSCDVRIDSKLMSEGWTAVTPHIEVKSNTADVADCMSGNANNGELMIHISPSENTLVTLVGSLGVQIMGMQASFDSGEGGDGSMYSYTNLPVGTYTIQANLLHPLYDIVCSASQLAFVTQSAQDIGILNMEETSMGNDHMVCPFSVFGTATAWQKYYTITLNQQLYAKWTETQKNEVSVVVWDESRGTASSALQMDSSKGQFVYKLPFPGAYSAEILVYSSVLKTTCSFHTPLYTVVEPAFRVENFVLGIQQYPRCAYSSDGVVSVTYPPGLGLKVRMSVSKCTVLNKGSSCTNLVYTANSISNVPFATVFTVEFFVSGACTFSKTIQILPLPRTYPTIRELRYIPTCYSTGHIIVPMDIDPLTGDEMRLYLGVGTLFEWNDHTTNDFLPVDPYSTRDYAVGLKITYNGGVCSTYLEAVIRASDLIKPPTLSITNQLPVFCPNGYDALITAQFSPATGNIVWEREGYSSLPTDSHVKVFANGKTTIDGIPSGVYTVHYTLRVEGGLFCELNATAVVSAKPNYNVLEYVSAIPSECAHGESKLSILLPEDTVNAPPEFTKITPDMLDPADRKYAKDMGKGVTELVGMPDGHTVGVWVLYPREYYHVSRMMCEERLQLTAGKTKSPPVMLNYMNNAMIPVFSELGFGICPLDIPLSFRSGRDNSLAFEVRVTPQTQTLQCPYDIPRDVVVEIVNRLSGQSVIERTYTFIEYASSLESSFENEQGGGTVYLYSVAIPGAKIYKLAETSSVFEVIVPQYVNLRSSLIIDPMCNLNPLMEIEFQISEEDDTKIRGATVITASVAEDRNCEGKRCTVSRTVPEEIRIVYESTTGGVCELYIMTDYLVDEAVNFCPDYKIEEGFTILLDNLEIASGVPLGIYRHESDVLDETCKYRHFVDVWTDNYDPPDDDSIQQTFTFPPSCGNSGDGMVDISFSSDLGIASAELMNADGGIYEGVFHERNTRVRQQSMVIEFGNLSSGVYVLKAKDHTDREYAKRITVPTPIPVSFVMAPIHMPVPEIGQTYFDDHETMRFSDTMMMTVFVRGATLLRGFALFIRSDEGATEVCMLKDFRHRFWDHTCEFKVAPDRTYTIEAGCDVNGQGHSHYLKRFHETNSITIYTEISPTMAIHCRVSLNPSSNVATDGEIEVLVSGGTSPFNYIWSDLNAVDSYHGDTHVRTGVSVGFYSVTVTDSSAGVDFSHRCSVYVDSAMGFEITAAVNTVPIGCSPTTHAIILLTVQSSNPITKIGAWDITSMDPEITSCSDSRLHPPNITNVTPGEYNLTVGQGRWIVAACDDTNALAVAGYDMVLNITTQNPPLNMTTVQGELCTPLSEEEDIVVYSPAIVTIFDAILPVFVYNTELITNITVVESVLYPNIPGAVDVSIDGLGAGLHSVWIEDATLCPTLIQISNVDTGVNDCDSCIVGDTSCYGCDNEPFSGLEYDVCGVCDGDEACLTDCDIELSPSTLPLVTQALELIEIRGCKTSVGVNNPVFNETNNMTTGSFPVNDIVKLIGITQVYGGVYVPQGDIFTLLNSDMPDIHVINSTHVMIIDSTVRGDIYITQPSALCDGLIKVNNTDVGLSAFTVRIRNSEVSGSVLYVLPNDLCSSGGGGIPGRIRLKLIDGDNFRVSSESKIDILLDEVSLEYLYLEGDGPFNVIGLGNVTKKIKYVDVTQHVSIDDTYYVACRILATAGQVQNVINLGTGSGRTLRFQQGDLRCTPDAIRLAIKEDPVTIDLDYNYGEGDYAVGVGMNDVIIPEGIDAFGVIMGVSVFVVFSVSAALFWYCLNYMC